MSIPETPTTSGSWDTYWQGTGGTGAYSSGGVSHPAITEFWHSLFLGVDKGKPRLALLDVATGNGAVVEQALAELGGALVDITCVDISDAAILNVRSRFPQIDGIVADAREIPLDDAGFDLVTSQFGAEYAGIAAIYEATRLVKPDGVLAMLLHIDTGSIHKECNDSLIAITRLQDANFIKLAREFFSAGFKACRGGDRAPYDDAGRQFAPAIQVAEQLMAEFGEHVAGDTVARLYDDVRRMHERIQHFDPDEVLQWLDAMDAELAAYAERMSSMMRSTIDKASFDDITNTLAERGFELRTAEALHPKGSDMPLAWAIVAAR